MSGLRDYKLYISDIETAINKVIDYTKDYDFNQFKNDSKTYESVLHNLFVIGEAANKIPDEIQLNHPDIDWRGIIGTRNIIAHGYFQIKPDIIWKTIQEDFPVLLKQIKKID